MLKQLVNLWKRSGIMIKAVDTFGSMLEDCAYVFENSWKVFTGELSMEAEKDNIHARDRQVNQKERDIRRMLLEHLTINPSEDASGCLALMSVVKDAERIGDYSKNILDLSKLLSKALPESRYLTKFRELYTQVDSFFPKTEKALFNDDEEAAHTVMEGHMTVNETCEGITQELLRDSGACGEDAIAFALAARYFKRVSSHLKNVASSAVNPYSQIGYFQMPEVKDEEEEDRD